VFDPERDHDPGVRPFFVRLVVVATVTLAASAALWPSVSGFSAGPDHDNSCVAIRDGWQSEVAAPSERALAHAYAAMPPPVTPAQQRDPQFMNRWRAQFHAAQANPTVIRANSRLEWLAGPGACVAESRHRLILSGLGLSALLLGVVASALYLRARRKRGPRITGSVVAAF
jgi:hypothetical protein